MAEPVPEALADFFADLVTGHHPLTTTFIQRISDLAIGDWLDLSSIVGTNAIESNLFGTLESWVGTWLPSPECPETHLLILFYGIEEMQTYVAIINREEVERLRHLQK